MALSFQQLSIANTNASDATFRAWGLAISTALAAVGLVKTSDTGQINWATVARPTTTHESKGYEIWRFDDALQATHPIFIKLEYGSGASVYSNVGMWMTVGTATDGAGTITAHASYPTSYTPRRQLHTNSGANAFTTTPSPVWVSSDGAGSLVLFGWMLPPGATSGVYAGLFAMVERTRDWDGDFNTQGALVTWAGNAQGINPSSQVLIIANSPTFAQGSPYGGVPAVTPAILTPASGMAPGGGVVHVWPIFTGHSPALNGPSKHIVATGSGDFPAYARFPLTVYGEAGTYVVLGTAGVGWNHGQSASFSAGVRVA